MACSGCRHDRSPVGSRCPESELPGTWSDSGRGYLGQASGRTHLPFRRPGPLAARYALWKNPENLTEKQQTNLAWIVQTDPTLGRAYYLKEGLRTVFQLPHDAAPEALDRWVAWARRCRIPRSSSCKRPSLNTGKHPRLDRARTLQRTHRVHEHQDQTHHRRRVRLQITPHRPGHAQFGRPQTLAPGPNLTHGRVRRAKFRLL